LLLSKSRVAEACLELMGAGRPCGWRSYDAASETIFAAFTTPPTDARKTVINNCVVALKAAGLWGKLDGLWMFAAADSQAALINWKNPGTFNASNVNSATFTADQGYAGNGSSSYIKTNLTLNTGGLNFTEDSASFGVWSRTTGQLANAVMAVATGGGTYSSLVVPRNASDNALSRNNQAAAGGEASASSVTDGSGLFHSTRVSNTSHDLYRNGGSSIATLSVESVAPGAQDFFFGASNADGGAGGFTTRQFAMGFVGGGNTSTEVANFYSAILAYMQAVGAA
jgi:hypothetical protein